MTPETPAKVTVTTLPDEPEYLPGTEETYAYIDAPLQSALAFKERAEQLKTENLRLKTPITCQIYGHVIGAEHCENCNVAQSEASLFAARKATCVDKCNHPDYFVCDYEDGTRHCLECVAEEKWFKDEPRIKELVSANDALLQSFNAERLRAEAAEAEVARIRDSKDDAEGKLASLADTVASALRNNGRNSDHIKLDTDLRDSVWQLSYDFIAAEAEVNALAMICAKRADHIAQLLSKPEQAETRAEAMAKNDGRYRFLRSERPSLQDGQPFIAIAHSGGCGFSGWTEEHADRAIDTAIEQGAQHG